MAELLLVAAFAAAYLGFALLALSLPRHWREVSGQASPSPSRHRALRPAGCLGLVLALAIALLRDGAAFGSVLGILLLTVGAAGVAFTLSWRPRWLAGLARRFR